MPKAEIGIVVTGDFDEHATKQIKTLIVAFTALVHAIAGASS